MYCAVIFFPYRFGVKVFLNEHGALKLTEVMLLCGKLITQYILLPKNNKRLHPHAFLIYSPMPTPLYIYVNLHPTNTLIHSPAHTCIYVDPHPTYITESCIPLHITHHSYNLYLTGQ